MTFRSGSNFKELVIQPDLDPCNIRPKHGETSNNNFERGKSSDSRTQTKLEEPTLNQTIPFDLDSKPIEPEAPLEQWTQQANPTDCTPPIRSAREKKKANDDEPSKYAPPSLFPKDYSTTGLTKSSRNLWTYRSNSR